MGQGAAGPLELALDNPNPAACQGRDVLADIRIEGDVTSGTAVWSGAPDSAARYSVHFGAAGAMAAAIEPGGVLPSGCVRGANIYLLEAPGGHGTDGPGLMRGATYVGQVRPLPSPFIRQPRPTGTAVLTVGVDGNIRSLILSAVDGSCAFQMATEATGLPVERGKFVQGAAFPTGGVAGVVEGSGQISGTVLFQNTGAAPASGCTASLADWTATWVPDAPTWSVDRARITSGRPPSKQKGIGLFVFGGGTSEELVAASCEGSIREAVFWADDGSGGMVIYIPATQLTVVNAAWSRRFAAGIPNATPILGRCLAPRVLPAQNELPAQ